MRLGLSKAVGEKVAEKSKNGEIWTIDGVRFKEGSIGKRRGKGYKRWREDRGCG